MSRWNAVYASWVLDLRRARLRREEARALERVGKSFRAAAPPDAVAAPVAEASAAVGALEERQRTLAQRLAESLEADRRDYRATGTSIGRALIVVRGILDRLVLRDEAWRARHALPATVAELGRRVLLDPSSSAVLPPAERQQGAEACAELQRATREREALLAPYGGEVVPRWLRAVLDELATFGSFVRNELTTRIFMRLPALAAMAAAWWVAHRFTTSSRWNWMKGEPRTGLPPQTLELLSFWLPLLAAAFVAYLMASVGRRLRKRYLDESGGR
jgi:hypothetical protein